MVQGGDFVSGSGRGSKTIFKAETFPDEGFPYNHEKYCVAMANSGPNTNGCQFFICTQAAPHLDGKHVVFGKVVDGFAVVDMLNDAAVDGDRPKSRWVISECGEM